MEIKERAMPGESDDDVMKSHLARYEFAAGLVKDKIVFSLACGVGYGEYLLLTKGKAKVVLGVDLSPEAINYARANYQAANLSFLLADVLKSGLAENSADVIISFETIEHIKDHNKFLSELKRILKPGGLLILSTPNKASSFKSLFSFRPINPSHVREYRKKSLEKMLAQYFTDINFYGQKKILKRSILSLPGYLVNKIFGNLAKLEKNDYAVRTYPGEKKYETCYFVVTCRKLN